MEIGVLACRGCYPWLASILDKNLLADDNIRQEQEFDIMIKQQEVKCAVKLLDYWKPNK